MSEQKRHPSDLNTISGSARRLDVYSSVFAHSSKGKLFVTPSLLLSTTKSFEPIAYWRTLLLLYIKKGKGVP